MERSGGYHLNQMIKLNITKCTEDTNHPRSIPVKQTNEKDSNQKEIVRQKFQEHYAK